MKRLSNIGVLILFFLTLTYTASAHCDTYQGPVVQDAIKALESGNVNHVLKWIRHEDETIIKAQFNKTMKLRNSSPEVKELADNYFFETLVRIHRQGEGEPYTGIKEGDVIPQIITTADNAIENSTAEEVHKLINKQIKDNLHHKFETLMKSRSFDIDDVQSGREYVKNYVVFMHYVENLFNTANASGHHHGTEKNHGEKQEIECDHHK